MALLNLRTLDILQNIVVGIMVLCTPLGEHKMIRVDNGFQ